MIFTSESGLTDPGRRNAWDDWYRGHLAAMVSVPGISSAQRFRALEHGPPPSLAMYTVASPAVFTNEIYLRVRGMGAFVSVVDESLHRRNLFDGLEAAPQIAIGDILLVADRATAGPAEPGLTWLHAIGLDCSTPYRGHGRNHRDAGSQPSRRGRWARRARAPRHQLQHDAGGARPLRARRVPTPADHGARAQPQASRGCVTHRRAAEPSRAEAQAATNSITRA